MVISSNVLFHFTNNADNLINILTNEFRPKYCLENLTNLFDDSTKEWHQAFPMVCFCDLPLSQLDEHLSFYGNYGLGMKKQWGISKGVNPVLYLHADSLLSESITTLMKYVLESEEKNAMESLAAITELTGYIKLYEGYIYRNERRVYKRFYDEKEWRWIPRFIKDGKIYRNYLNEEEFKNPVKRAQANSLIFNYDWLAFEPDDIKYIIVAREEEILPMIEAIEQIKEKYDIDKVRLLTSKIISSEQIKEDF